MELQSFVDTVAMPCCVLEVTCGGDNTNPAIRIHCANEAYRKKMGPSYYDGMPYDELVPKDNKFEDYCFRSAILGQRMHAYVDTKALHAWTDQTMIPLLGPARENPDGTKTGYCQFIFEFTKTSDPERMAIVSVSTAETVIRACIELMGKGDFKSNLAKSLDSILDYSEAKACRIMLVDHENQRAINLCERVSKDARPLLDVGGDYISYELICSWKDMIGVSNCIIVQNESDMASLGELNPAWAKSLTDAGVRSMILIPLRREQKVIGYLYVVNFNTALTVEVKELVELMSFFLGSEISNQLLMKKLDEMSRIDTLTGLHNRRAMVEKMNAILPGTSFGVINLDLNGLKRINDTQGHEAGDRFLAEASNVLIKMFCPDDIFRAGGDEFIVLSEGISQESFNRRLEKLRTSIIKDGEAMFSLGGYWSDGTVDVRRALRMADEQMYADKQEYYLCHPEKKKR